MERLTVPAERLPDGGTRMQVVDARAVREHAMELYWRLKKYEDTGLSPEDVTDLMGSHAVAIGELAKMPKWIPVTERLPEKDRAVLVRDRVTGEIATAHLNDFDSFVFTDGRGHGASHWMPLPEPPKEVPVDA